MTKTTIKTMYERKKEGKKDRRLKKERMQEGKKKEKRLKKKKMRETDELKDW